MNYIYDVDFSDDFLRWIRVCERLNLSSKREIKKLEEEIINYNDPALAYFFACEFKYDHHKMQDIIINNKSTKYSFLFAKNIENASVKTLQNIVIKSNNLKYIAKFGCYVAGADSKKIENILYKSKNYKYISLLLTSGKVSNLNRFKKIIFESGKPKYIFQLAKVFKTKRDIQKIEDALIKLSNPLYMRLLAQQTKMANLEKLENAILETGDLEQIKKFAKYVKGSKIKNFMLSF